MRDQIELGKMQVQQSQWGSKYALNEDMSMKAKLASMARRIEEFELRNVHTEAQPQAMPTSFEYINHPNLTTQPQPQPSMSTSSLEQAILKISKVMEDFVGEQQKINSHLNEKIDNLESSVNVRMEGVYNDLSLRIEKVQDSIEKLTNLDIERGKRKLPPQPHHNLQGTNAKRSRKVLKIDTLVGDCYDNSMDQPSIENHKVQDDKGLPKPLKHPLLRGREEKRIPLDQMGRMPILFGIQGEFSMKWVVYLLNSKSTSHEDALVQVDKFYYPVDFVVLDTDPTVKEANYVPIILGRPSWLPPMPSSIVEMGHLHPDEDEGLEELWRTPKLVLKPLPVNLKYAYLEEDEKCPVVVSSNLTSDQEDSLLGVLRKCKKAIGWQISDLKGISPLVCTHHIYMEEDAKPVRQPQRRLNPHMQEVVRGEVLKLLQAGIIYPISDSLWVSPTQVVPKKSGITVIQNEKGEEVSTRPTSGWRVCIDYRRRMPFGLCNAPATFQRCMLSIFSDMVERIMEVFMDDITVYGSIVLGHVISKNGIEVDKAKVELIVKLPPPTNVKGIRQFLGHAGFYRRFIKDFSKISKPLCELLVKDAKFVWDEKCQKSFEE
ncbi:Retrovirus-related Pol polyprotein from transposon 17.6 [Vitis vinifera]|uniref:Retrovirus-related Pol polyprotein from transposon 17.6 n=1 Tax=Vitis vinifera TaxID=29760 RepID=A0A438GBS5_VITVI|nr:Retrovirus-related Pol polyprotein from transposon 17.6 [Vitis vinifera]